MKNIENLTIKEARELIPHARDLLATFCDSASVTPSPNLPYPVGTPVYVRGAIYSVVGKIAGINGIWLELTEASYIGTDGRFHDASKNGIQSVENSEIEPFAEGSCRVNTGAISDVSIHPNLLPTKQK